MMVVVSSAAPWGLLPGILHNLGIGLRRPENIARVQILAEGLEILLESCLLRLRTAGGRGRR